MIITKLAVIFVILSLLISLLKLNVVKIKSYSLLIWTAF